MIISGFGYIIYEIIVVLLYEFNKNMKCFTLLLLAIDGKVLISDTI